MWVPLVAAAVLVIALAAAFAFGTEARRTASAEALALAAGLAGALGIVFVAGSVRRVTRFDTGASLIAFGLGALALTLAPYAVMLHRYSDAPPGSEVLFFTTAARAALLLLLLALTGRDALTSRLRLGVGALIGLPAVAGIVANWERPSSFSPFFRYVSEETWFLLAGFAVALLWWWLDAERARGALPAASFSAAAGGVAAALALGLNRIDHLGLDVALADSGLLLYAASVALGTAAALVLLRSVGARGVAAAYFLPAAALTVLTYLEQATKAFGPQPVLLLPAAAGSLAALGAAVLVAAGPRSADAASGAPRSRLATASLALAAASALAAAASLALPAVRGHAVGLGQMGETIDVTFDLVGAESVAGWLALGVALGALVLAFAAVRGERAGARLGRLVPPAALLAAAAAWPLLRDTPLRSLTTFIPSEVQVDFGSEFASITYNALATPVALAAVIGAVLALALLLVRLACPVMGTDVPADAPSSEGEGL